MKNLTNRQLAKEFNKFLRENKCASKFYTAFYKRHPKEKIKILTRTAPVYWVASSFTWKRTLQGHGHWENIDLKWGQRLKEIGHKS